MLLLYFHTDEIGLASKISQLLKDVVREASVVKSLEAAKGLTIQRVCNFGFGDKLYTGFPTLQIFLYFWTRQN